MCPQHSAEGPAQSRCLTLPNRRSINPMREGHAHSFPWNIDSGRARGLVTGSVFFSPLNDEGAAVCKKTNIAHQAL